MKEVMKVVIGILITLAILTVLIVLAVKGVINWASGGSIVACLIAVVATLIITEKYK